MGSENSELQIRVVESQALAAIEQIDRNVRWLSILKDAFGHRPYLIEAVSAGQVVGRLPLSFVRSMLFGRHLVSLPYINSAGIETDSPDAARGMIDRAVQLADELDCRFLELRHETLFPHPALNGEMAEKVHMRFRLPATEDDLWTGLKSSVRNQVKKGQKQDFSIHWGGQELLDDFYSVFSRRMRELGTPVFGRILFKTILERFGDAAELCVVRDGKSPVAAALLIHEGITTEVPSASSLSQYNSSNANMLMYWHLLARAVERRQEVFDFGRSTRDGGTYRFKKQWGAEPESATWQYYIRQGSADNLRPDNPRNQRLIRIWKRLPIGLTRWLGPMIVRGIP